MIRPRARVVWRPSPRSTRRPSVAPLHRACLGIRHGESRPVSAERRPGRPAAVARSDLTRTSPAAAAKPGAGRSRPAGQDPRPKGKPQSLVPGQNQCGGLGRRTKRPAMSACRPPFPIPKGLLRPGMFVNAEVPLPDKEHHVVIPATASTIRSLRRHGLHRRGHAKGANSPTDRPPASGENRRNLRRQGHHSRRREARRGGRDLRRSSSCARVRPSPSTTQIPPKQHTRPNPEDT